MLYEPKPDRGSGTSLAVPLKCDVRSKLRPTVFLLLTPSMGRHLGRTTTTYPQKTMFQLSIHKYLITLYRNKSKGFVRKNGKSRGK